MEFMEHHQRITKADRFAEQVAEFVPRNLTRAETLDGGAFGDGGHVVHPKAPSIAASISAIVNGCPLTLFSGFASTRY